MNLLNTYIVKEFLRFFFTVLVGILSVYLCVDFLQRADNFIRHGANIFQISKYYVYTLPSIASPSIPIAALIATLLSLGNFSRHNEIIAMRAGGLSIGKVIAPVLFTGLLISAFGFINNEIIMPHYSARANHIQKVVVEKKAQRVVFQKRHLWLRGPDNSIANIEFVSPDRFEMFGVHIYKFNPDYTLRERIEADSLLWEDGAWRLRNSRKYIPIGSRVFTDKADGEIYNVVEAPEDLGMIVKRSGEMNFKELWEYVERLKISGYNAARYEVDLHGKLAFPLSSLLMVMIATPLSLHRVRSGGASRGIALAVFIAFGYWALLSVGTALGRSGTLPPVVAGWLANALFAAVSAYALRKLHREL